jgi:hypothetical protein
MTTTANELGEREEKGKQDKETKGKTDCTWICTSNVLYKHENVQLQKQRTKKQTN